MKRKGWRREERERGGEKGGEMIFIARCGLFAAFRQKKIFIEKEKDFLSRTKPDQD